MLRHVSTVPAAALIALCTVASAQAADEAAVIVTATRQAQRVSELMNDVTVIDREQIEQAGAGSIVDLLSRQPGIQMMQNGGQGTTSELYLRGTRTDQTKIIIDGTPINSMDLKGSPLRLIPLAEVERIEIVRGPASVLYGADAIGGVIQVFTRRGGERSGAEVVAGVGSYGARRAEGALYGGDERWRYSFGASDFETRGFSAVRNATNKDADRDAHRNAGFNGSVAFTPARGQEVSATWMRNRGQTRFDSTSGTGSFDSRLDFRNEVWSVAARSALNAAWTTSLRYGRSIDDQVNYTSATPNALVTEGRQIAWQNDLKLPLGTGLVLLERQEQEAGPRSRFPGNTETRDDALALAWRAGHGDHRWQWGGRRDRHSSFGRHGTWAASYGYQVDPQWRASVSAGTSFKAPTLYQLYIATNGNAALQPEEGRNAELLLAWELGAWTASATRFRNRVENMIDYSTASNRYENISRASFAGWTLALGGRLDAWTLAGSLDLLDARNDATGKLLERRARRKLNLSAGRDWGAWRTMLEVAAVGRRYNSATETQAMGGYTLLNLVVRHAFSPSLSLELRGDNLTDKRYATAMTSNGLRDYATPGASFFASLRYTH